MISIEINEKLYVPFPNFGLLGDLHKPFRVGGQISKIQSISRVLNIHYHDLE